MKKITSLFLAVVMAAFSLLSLSSCGLVQDGAEISVYLSDEVYDLDPAACYTDDNALLLISLLFEPLFVLDDDGKVQKAAAEEYDYDKDTGALEIVLRESYWNNGERVLASDFVYAWRRILDPDFSSPAAALLYDVKNAVAIKQGKLPVDDLGVNALNEDTIEIVFEKDSIDYKDFLRKLTSVALSPVHQVTVENNVTENLTVGEEKITYEYWAKTFNSLYCNGPFKLRNISADNGLLTLARNDGYHRKDGSSKAVDAYVAPSMLRTLWNNNENMSDEDHLDKMYKFVEEKVMFYVSNLSLEARKTAKDVETVDRLSTYVYAFNTQNPLFANKEVRKILSSVIDRDYIIANLVIFGQSATGLIPPAVNNVRKSDSFRQKAGDLLSATATKTIDAANAALDELAPLNGDFRGSFELTYNEDHEVEVAIAYYVYGIWSQLGYDITLNGVSSITLDENSYDEAALQFTYETGDFDVIAFDYQMLCADAFAAFAAMSSTLNGNANGAGNNVGWVNADYDARVQNALYESDAKKRAEELREAEKILMEELPIMPLYFKQTYYVKSSKLKNVEFAYNGFPVFTDVKLKGYDKYFFSALQSTLFPEEEEE